MPTRSSWLGWFIAVIGLVVLAVFFYPHVKAMNELIYGADRWFELFSNRLNWPSNWSRVAATIFSLLTALSWPAAALAGYYIWRRPGAQKVIVCAIAYVLVFAGAPALLAAFGANVCFAKDGTTDKWYVESADHQLTIYDSGGYDSLGNKKVKATPEICRRYALQSSGNQPTRVRYSSDMRFFSGSGAALVWYYKTADGNIELYDKSGYHPTLGDALSPISRDVVEEMQRGELLRQKTEAENARLAAGKAERDQLKNAIEQVKSNGGTSFDCDKARSSIELLLCSNTSLAELDRTLGEALGTASGGLTSSERTKLVEDQRRWLTARNKRCAFEGTFKLDSAEADRVKKCLSNAISERTADFQLGSPATTATAYDTETTKQAPPPSPPGFPPIR